MPKRRLPATETEQELDEDELLLPSDLEENLSRAEDLLIQAFQILKRSMPTVLACAIATQVIEDLASLESQQTELPQ